MRALLIALPALLAGCMFQSLTPAEKLREAVLDLNESARWGRLDVATTRVHGVYRNDFALRHHAWGRTIQLADVEVIEVRMVDAPEGTEEEDDEESTEPTADASATIAYNWYSLDTMTLHSSVIRQTWTKANLMVFELTDEQILDGDARLLEPPPEPEPEPDAERGTELEARTSGGESPPAS